MEIDFTSLWTQIDEELQKLKLLKKNKFTENIISACKALIEFGECEVTNPYFTGEKFDLDKEENRVYLYFTTNRRKMWGLTKVCVQITEFVSSKLIESRIYGEWPEIPAIKAVKMDGENVILEFHDKSKYTLTPDKLQVRNKRSGITKMRL